MNNQFQEKTDQSYFIKKEPVIKEELEITPVIDLDAVKTKLDEPNQSEKNDLNFPIETQSNFPIGNQAMPWRYTSENSDNLTAPELFENNLSNEIPVEIKIEPIEKIDFKEHITFESIAEVDIKENIKFEPIAEVDVKESIKFEPLELDIKVNVKTEENVVKQQLGIDVTDNLINAKSVSKDTAQKVARKAQKRVRKLLKHECIFCGEKFTTKCKMNEHIKTHRPNKPTCKCRHSYMNVHVMSPGGVPFACNLCKLVTCTRADLRRHMVKFHDMKSDVYMCHHCHSSFSKKDHLIAHLKMQSDDYTSHYKCSNTNYKLAKGFKYDYDTRLIKK